MALVIVMACGQDVVAELTASPGESAVITASDFHEFSEKRAALGQLLFYDPILSGNRNISCGTCHHHDGASTESLSLGVGEGGDGVGAARTVGKGPAKIKRRVARNTPSLFNLGAREVSVLFHDGRLSFDDRYGNNFDSPAEEYLPQGLDSILAAQALFPLINEIEMAGAAEENEIGAAVYTRDRIDYVWPLIAERVRFIPGYELLFADAFADVWSNQDITIVHIANAIGDFVGLEWQSFDSAYDRYLAGHGEAMTGQQKAGLEIFFGKAACSTCHSGKFFTDQKFYALALPQFGPGRTRMFDPVARDVGRMGETDHLEDAYRFRTPSLRNVAITGPYGHNGAYRDLEGIIRHHLDPLAALDNWRPNNIVLPKTDERMQQLDYVSFANQLEIARLRRHVDIQSMVLGNEEIVSLVAFLQALTGGESVDGRLGKPNAVPSGLPVD